MSIYKKLLEIQKAVDSFVKDSIGPNGNYKFTSGSKVLGKIRPLMNENGLILKQEVLDLENTRIDYETKYSGNKSETLSKAKLKFTWVDVETGEKDENLFFANGMNGWDKGLGSALTYAERYFLLKYFHVPTDEDDIDNKKDEEQGGTAKKDDKKTGNKNADDKKSGSKEKTFNRKETIAWLKKKYESAPENEKAFLKEELKKLGKSAFDYCKDTELKEIIAGLKAIRKKEPDPVDESQIMIDYIEKHKGKHGKLIDEILKKENEGFVSMLDKEPLTELYNLIKGVEDSKTA